MAMTNIETSGTGRPWLEEFETSPEAEFAELLAGHADIFPYDRADAPDAVQMLFGAFPPAHPLREALDGAVLAWLNQRRSQSIPEKRPRLQRSIREICEAFEIVALLNLPLVATALRREYVRWNNWVSRLTLSPSRDARAEYLRTLAERWPIYIWIISAGDPPTRSRH